MPLLGAFIKGAPGNYVFYDFFTPTFTIAGGATGSPYAVPGSVQSFPINSVYTGTAFGPVNTKRLIDLLDMNIRGVVTTNTTDSLTFSLQISTDGGSSWANFGNTTTVAGSNQNNVLLRAFQGLTVGEINGAVTNNTLLLRSVFDDATSPTTDAFTITNLKVQYSMVVAS